MRLSNLPAILRGAGLDVEEVAGWRGRGSDSFGPLVGLTCHHTGGSRTSTDAGELRVLVNGRGSPGDPDYLPGPISQLYLSRSGVWHVVASGRANHNKVGWGGPNRGYGNTNLVGVEAQHSGAGEPWGARQYDSYVRGVAALCNGLGFRPARVAGHKEHQPGNKTDPSFNMDTFRRQVIELAAELEGGEDMPTAEEIARELLTTEVGASGPNVGLHLQNTLDTVVTLPAKFNDLGNRLDAIEAGQAEILELLRAPAGQTPTG